MDDLAPMIIFVVFFLVAGAVAILRPLVTRLGPLIEAMTREKVEGRSGDDLRAIRDSLDMMAQRIDLLEERQAFTESLLGSGRQKVSELPAPPERG